MVVNWNKKLVRKKVKKRSILFYELIVVIVIVICYCFCSSSFWHFIKLFMRKKEERERKTEKQIGEYPRSIVHPNQGKI